ncbi:RNA polymerase sigma-70 factor, ECF subfamily [Singulisphaera sp. GP187]|uniref:RNA polymerase sigma factor n=1 Tax=Singulisphaera sp. GP187 TaxID=1882752 RepID=UPI000927B500|nr:ECF-type sigma factor [Singulisphaera sp. GP187]SIO31401.1 RNA polymerase sigma-70 factor, ECF subfamily [Singulisphaera sp. GP187]
MDESSHTLFSVLVDRARSGDERALAELAGQYEAEVRIAARVLLGPLLRPHVDSMDLVQSIHRSLLVGLRANKFAFSRPEQLLALVLTMVRRKAAQCVRIQSRRLRLTTEAVTSGSWPSIEANTHGNDPAVVVEHDDELRHLMDRLDGTERRVVELRLQGYSTAEAARELGLDADVLRVRLSRLRRKLVNSERRLAEAI